MDMAGDDFYAALGGFIGGIFPDLDLAFNHRRTLHYPIIFSISSLISGAVVILAPSLVSVAVFYFFLSAAVHSLIDVFWRRTRDTSMDTLGR